MHPPLALFALNPVLPIVRFVEEHLVAVYAIKILLVAVCANGAQLIHTLLPLAVVTVEAELVAASGTGSWEGLRGCLGLRNHHDVLNDGINNILGVMAIKG
jgi:hypothetical protein